MPVCWARLRWPCNTSARNDGVAAALQRFALISMRAGSRMIRNTPSRHAAVAPFTRVMPGAMP